MTLKLQATAFQRTEDYDNLNGTWVRKIKTNDLMNFVVDATTNSTTGDVTLASTVVGTNEAVYVYALASRNDGTNVNVALRVDGTNVWTFRGSQDNVSVPEAPFAVVFEGSTISWVALGYTTTATTFYCSAVGKIEPIPARIEPQLS